MEVTAFQNITPATWENAFHTYYEGLHRYAYTLLKENEAARDAVQHIFANLWEKRDTIVLRGSAKAYLYTAVYNHCLNLTTRGKKHVPLPGIELNDTLSGELLVEAKELYERITRTIDELPPQCKTVFMKSREEGKTYPEIAAELDISVKTVEAQISKALKILRNNITHYVGLLLITLHNFIN